MTNEEIWLYKKAQNGGKSDPRYAMQNNNISISVQELTETATIVKENE